MRSEPDAGRTMLALYERALPEVFGYLLDRCGDRPTAEDLTSETFLAAVRAVDRADGADGVEPNIPWPIGVARHKLADHWRRRAREDRLVDDLSDQVSVDDPWNVRLSPLEAADVLAQLGDHHRLALTFRYVDGLSVPEVAALLERTVHATEALLVRARVAFRKSYEKGDAGA